jgi:phosphoglycerol transferase MdoB-like AlkP superfamily enzyme
MTLAKAIKCLADGDISCFIHTLKDIASSSTKSLSDAYSNAIDMITTGMAMFIDDIMDFPKTDRPHHWMWGLILVIAGIIILILAAVFIFLGI